MCLKNDAGTKPANPETRPWKNKLRAWKQSESKLSQAQLVGCAGGLEGREGPGREARDKVEHFVFTAR